MNSIGQLERITQDRVVELFQDKLDYRYDVNKAVYSKLRYGVKVPLIWQ